MTPAIRLLIVLHLVALLLFAVASATWTRQLNDARASEAAAWAEVQTLRATLAAHRIDIDYIEF